MKEYTRNFKKIIPHLRDTTLEAIEIQPIYGERIEVPVEDDVIEVYFHRATSQKAPVLFELHGGGFVLGHAAKNDALCELIKNKLDIHVVGINYRKAPEYPYPTAIEDVLAVLQYFSDNSDDYCMEPKKFALMGFSAGANLATVVSMKSKHEKAYHIICQVLHYPCLDAISDPETKDKHPADLPCEVMDAFNDLYSEEEERSLPWVSPVAASSDLLSGIAPTIIITAKEDALCKEGLRYAEGLKAAGILVEPFVIEYAHHGYIEDYYNEVCYDTIPEDTKASFHSRFGEAAEHALQITMERLAYYLA